MNTDAIAFFIGLFGSIHCIGMCGPLAFAMPVKSPGFWLLLWDKLIYNAGRIISYTLLGLMIGLAGKQLWLSGLQQGVSIVSGVLIILAASSRLLKLKSGNIGGLEASLMAPFNRLLSFALRHRAGHLIIGVLNGFLPCGFVYLALVGAVNTPSVIGAARYMALFGLGTLPLMLVATISSGLLSKKSRGMMNKVVPYFMLFLGIWFILRGLALNIPYLSPAPTAASSICK